MISVISKTVQRVLKRDKKGTKRRDRKTKWPEKCLAEGEIFFFLNLDLDDVYT